jgi:iron only hydrogenase large subunit-like protein
VIAKIAPDREIEVEYGDGLRECRRMMTMAKAGKRHGYLLEGMACPGGCVAGAGTITPVLNATSNVRTYKVKAEKQSALDSGYLDRLKEVEE